jgi:hypothetical protein
MPECITKSLGWLLAAFADFPLIDDNVVFVCNAVDQENSPKCMHPRRYYTRVPGEERRLNSGDPMEFFDTVKSRHSIRAFAATPIDDDTLQAILEAANWAPSAGNLQAYEIYMVTQDHDRSALARAAFEQWFVARAPVVVFCAHPERSARRYGQRGVRLYAIQDATIACTFAMLAATALGLATVWVGAFETMQYGAPSRCQRHSYPWLFCRWDTRQRERKQRLDGH